LETVGAVTVRFAVAESGPPAAVIVTGVSEATGTVLTLKATGAVELAGMVTDTGVKLTGAPEGALTLTVVAVDTAFARATLPLTELPPATIAALSESDSASA
jgi:hypothetical protein